MMNDDIYKMYRNLIVRQNAMLDSLNALTKAFANQYNLAIEDSEEECEYINADERPNN